jgi:hypothetical protein
MCQRKMASSVKHAEEICFNRLVWARKPCLRKVYHSFYETLRRRLKCVPGKLTVELGSGMGNLKEVIPECVTTDIFSHDGLDREENAYALSLPDNSVGNLILFDVWHHLEYPGTALQEFSRVVVKGGRVILLEPAISVLGRLVYGSLHPESLGLREPIEWIAPAGFDPARAPYFAAQSRAARIFQRREVDCWTSEWELVSLEGILSFAYLLSGGFSRPQLYPESFLPAIQWVDRLLARFTNLLAVRLLIVLEKKLSNA